MPIYDPDNTVSRPDTLPANNLGLTTQNKVRSVNSGLAWLVVATVTST